MKILLDAIECRSKEILKLNRHNLECIKDITNPEISNLNEIKKQIFIKCIDDNEYDYNFIKKIIINMYKYFPPSCEKPIIDFSVVIHKMLRIICITSYAGSYV